MDHSQSHCKMGHKNPKSMLRALLLVVLGLLAKESIDVSSRASTTAFVGQPWSLSRKTHVPRAATAQWGEYTRQVVQLSNVLADFLKNSEASKFPDSLSEKIKELQQSGEKLSKSQIQQDVKECIDDLRSIAWSPQGPTNFRRKLENVEALFYEIKETLKERKSLTQDVEKKIKCIKHDLCDVQKKAQKSRGKWGLGWKVLAGVASCAAVVTVVAFALPVLAAGGGAAAAGTAAAAVEGTVATTAAAAAVEGAVATTVVEGAVALTAAAGTVAVEAAGTATTVGTVAGVGTGLSSCGAYILKSGEEGCQQLLGLLDQHKQSLAEQQKEVKNCGTQIDEFDNDLSKLLKRLDMASGAIKAEDVADAARICGRVADRLSEYV